MTPGEELLKESKKIVWDLSHGKIIKTQGIKKAIERVESDNEIEKVFICGNCNSRWGYDKELKRMYLNYV